MSWYRTLADDAKPKIFGMSASPNKTGIGFDIAKKRLEKTLDCKIFTPSEYTAAELNAHVNKPKIMLLEYEARTELPISQLTKRVLEEIKDMANFDEIAQRTYQM